MTWPANIDAIVVDVLRGRLARALAYDPVALLRAAERHGVSGVVADEWRRTGTPLPPGLAREVALVDAARELDHAAHLDTLQSIDRAFAASDLAAVALKGPLFAERFYARPATRATSDLDLLVAESDLARAEDVLIGEGWIAATGPEEDRFRREQHHLHFSHPRALPLELHFHAYVGFGRVLPSRPLVERSLRPRVPLSFSAVRVLSGPDELVFLAVHAAMHRFVRLGWLYDLHLLLATLGEDDRAVAEERAAKWGFDRALALTYSLLDELFETPETRRNRTTSIKLARRWVGEPSVPIVRSATRLLYTVALSGSSGAALRYATRASLGHARQILGLAP